MTLTFNQDPCQDIDNNYRDNNLFKRSVLRILCKLVPSLSNLLGKVGLVDASGNDISITNPLPVGATIVIPGGISTAANQTTEIAALTSIDGKITACDTNNVTVIAAPVPAGAATEATLLAIDGKITAADTGNVTVSSSALPTGAATEATLSSIDGKITTCDTSNIAGTVAISQAVTGTTNAVVITDTTGKDLDLRQENENWNAADHGILTFGRDIESIPNKYRAIALNTEGDIQVVLSEINGAEPSVNNGTVDSGTLRVTVASDSTGKIAISQATPGTTNGVTITDGATTATVRNLAANDALNVALVDAAGNQVTSFGGGTQYTEDDPAAANPIGTAPIMVRQDTPAGLVTTNGDNVAQRCTNYGAAFCQILTSAGAFVDTFGGGTQYADGAARGSATGTLSMGDDGVNIQSLKCDSNGVLAIQDNGGAITIDGSVTVSNAAGGSAVNIQDGGNTITVDGSVTVTQATATNCKVSAEQATASNLNAQVVGSVAHDSPDSGNPIKIGGIARSASPTAVGASDRVDATFDKVGRQVVLPYSLRELIGVSQVSIAGSSAETTVISAVASTYCDITSLSITNATATAVTATLKDSTGGTTRGIYALAASGGIVLTFNPPMPQSATNQNWTITLSVNTVTVHISSVYVKNI